jgi:hypothetical protein
VKKNTWSCPLTIYTKQDLQLVFFHIAGLLEIESEGLLLIELEDKYILRFKIV